jgi:hypothetical protein
MYDAVRGEHDKEDDDDMLAAALFLEESKKEKLTVPALVAGVMQGHALAANTQHVTAQDFQNSVHCLEGLMQSQHQQPQAHLNGQRMQPVPNAPETLPSTGYADIVRDGKCLSEQASISQQPFRNTQLHALTSTKACDPVQKRNRDMVSRGVVQTQVHATNAVRMAHFYEMLSKSYCQPAHVQWTSIYDFVLQYSNA